MDLGSPDHVSSLVVTDDCAATDYVGLTAFFGLSVTRSPNTQFLADAINAAHGTALTKDFFAELGPRDAAARDASSTTGGRLHPEGRRAAWFFYSEPVPPTNHVARFHAADVHSCTTSLPNLSSPEPDEHVAAHVAAVTTRTRKAEWAT